MKEKTYREICRDVTEGKMREIEHMITHGHGKVVACTREGFEVEMGGMHQTWDRHNCMDLKMS